MTVNTDRKNSLLQSGFSGGVSRIISPIFIMDNSDRYLVLISNPVFQSCVDIRPSRNDSSRVFLERCMQWESIRTYDRRIISSLDLAG
jgi:hypothetical protein